MGGVDPAEIDGLKRGMRSAMLRELRRFPAERAGVSSRAVHHLLDGGDTGSRWASGEPVMAYLAMGSEVDLDGLWALPGRPPLAAPRVSWRAGTMEPVLVEDLVRDVGTGARGVRQPGSGCGVVGASSLTMVLVPGLAFDRSGNRLGRGGGFYDRFLAMAPGALLVGVCWSAQVVERVPALPHDRRVHMLLTEDGVRDLRR